MVKKLIFFIKVTSLLIVINIMNNFSIDDGTIQTIIETAIFYYRRVKPYIIYTIMMVLHLLFLQIYPFFAFNL